MCNYEGRYMEDDFVDESLIEGYNEDFDEDDFDDDLEDDAFEDDLDENDEELSEEEMFEDAVNLMYPNADEEELEEELGDRLQKFY